MGRKKQIFLQLYTKDYTGDEKLRMCSPAAWGVYSYLLCLMNSAKVRGEYRLSTLERRPELKRSLTQRSLTATSDDKRMAPFAEILQRQMPWKKTEILRALKELLFYRVIILEEDAILQPRMYRESGHHLKSEMEPNEVDDTASELQNDAENNKDVLAHDKGTKKGSFSGPENDEKTDVHAHAIAHAPYENMSYKNINNNNDKKNDSENEKTKTKKTETFSPPTLEEVRAYFAERGTSISPDAFWAHYEANGWVQSRGKPIKNWKACLTTWELRHGEFGNGAEATKQRRKTHVVAKPDDDFEDDW